MKNEKNAVSAPSATTPKHVEKCENAWICLMYPNQKVDENQPALELNFTLKYKCAGHEFEFGGNCPLLSIGIHCCPLLSIVVHCCPVLIQIIQKML